MTGLSKVLLAVGASLAVGAALGILYAPDEGVETRRKIARRGKKLIGSVKDGIDDGRESLEEVKDVLQRQISRINQKLEQVF
ncbi:MAG: YtxH-like protein [Flavipsychrobacter sp.]|jgi:gas vesicle protein|nr:YtxH-like protein [Flavipsychrobacter sp.]